MKIYLASPFFNEEENKYVEMAEKILRGRNFEVFSPRESEPRGLEVGSNAWSRSIYKMDVSEIGSCDCMVMLYYGGVSDSGTAWECGYATAKKIPVVIVHIHAGKTDSNVMIHESGTNLSGIEALRGFDFEKMEHFDYTGKML